MTGGNWVDCQFLKYLQRKKGRLAHGPHDATRKKKAENCSQGSCVGLHDQDKDGQGLGPTGKNAGASKVGNDRGGENRLWKWTAKNSACAKKAREKAQRKREGEAVGGKKV